MKRIHLVFTATIVVSLLNFIPSGSSWAAITTETGFGTTWPAGSGDTVVEFTARTGKSSDWKLGHKINGSDVDTQNYTWPLWGDYPAGFTLTHDSSTGTFTLTLAETQDSPAASTTWNSGRASCERVKDIWIRAGSVQNGSISTITVATLNGQPIDVILTADANGEMNWLHIYGESFKDFTLSGTMLMDWSDGAKEAQKVQQINLISVVFEGDSDSDGFVDGCDNCPSVQNAGQEDCNSNGLGDVCDAVNPNAEEICDAIDNNCNGQNNEGLSFDVDLDGYTSIGSCEGSADDCNDAVGSINPGASDANCDGIDQNCSDGADEGYVSETTSCGLGVCAATGSTSCVAGNVEDSCEPGLPSSEICNGDDDDCDGTVDNDIADIITGIDTGECQFGIQSCIGGSFQVTQNQIDPVTETCDGLDNDCDDVIDNGFDMDGDTFTSCGGDCDDGDNTVFPGALEICNGIDNNCVAGIDDEVTTTFFQDADLDNFGNPLVTADACSVPAGYVADGTDCDDTEPLNFPGNTEVCDGVDNDCDSLVDNVPQGCTVQSKYESIIGSGTITLPAAVYEENLILDRDVIVTFVGDPGMLTAIAAPVPALPALPEPAMTITAGTVILDKIVLQ